MLSPKEELEALSVMPGVTERNRAATARIEQAQTPEALLDLAAKARGLPRFLWQERLQAYGPEVLPLIEGRLRSALDLEFKARANVYEPLITALYAMGAPAIGVLHAVLPDLDAYGRSLANMTLGMLGSQEDADALWNDFMDTRWGVPEEGFFIGPLWALVDLGDPRAAEELSELAEGGLFFHEIFPMLARAGDERAIVPVILALIENEDEDFKWNATAALAAIAQRVGRERLLAALQERGIDEGEAQEVADDLLARPPEYAEKCFDSFFTPTYKGYSKEDLAVLQASLQQAKTLGYLPPTQEHRADIQPGRNDPCWCGSGKKYKQCHWKQDQEEGRWQKNDG